MGVMILHDPHEKFKQVIDAEAEKVGEGNSVELSHLEKKLFQRRIKSYRVKGLKIALAVLVLLCMVACARPIRDFVIQIFEQFSELTFYNGDSPSQPVTETNTGLQVWYLPEGYVEIEGRVEEKFLTYLSYEKSGKDKLSKINIIFSSSETVNKYLDNENLTQREIVDLDGRNCYIFESKNSDDIVAVMQTENGVLEVTGYNIEKKTIIKIIGEIEMKEGENKQ